MVKPNENWIIVANSSSARIFKFEKQHQLIQIKILEHKESRLLDRDLLSSKPGRTFDSMQYGSRHSMEPPTSQHRIEFSNFAKSLSEFLENSRRNGEFARLLLIASPSFLGLLRQEMNPQLIQVIEREIDKDMTHNKLEEIQSYLINL